MIQKTTPLQYIISILIALLAACTPLLPQSTPTTAPRNTPVFHIPTTTQTPTVTQTPTILPTETPVIPSSTPTPPEKQSSVIISGIIDSEKGTGSLDSMYILEAKPDIPVPGAYAIRFEDNTRQEIITYSFDSTYGSVLSNFVSFAFILPWNNNTTRIVLLKDSVELASRSASANAPEIHIVSPNRGENLSEKTATIQWKATDKDGDPLSYVVQYSVDGGKTWVTQSIDFPDTKFDLNLDVIPNTETGLIRVLASDGFYTAQDVSDEIFTVKTQAGSSLHVDIDEDGGEFAGDQTVILEGEAYSNTGSLPEDEVEYTWSSNIDGVLGQGSSLSINALELSEGKHTIALTAEYDGFQPGTDSIEIMIYREFSSLSIDKKELKFNAKLGDPGVMDQVIEIWHLGNHSITWSAKADQTWLVLNQVGKTTPSYLQVSVDPTGLPAGSYTGSITISSNAEGTKSHAISVTLVVH